MYLIALLALFLVPSGAKGASFDSIVRNMESALDYVLFIEIFHLPLIILILVSSAMFYTIKFRFVNIMLFKHAMLILTGKCKNDGKTGEINHFQAFSTAVAGTMGLGTIAGVAVAISIGGPGAMVWMMIAGFLGMSSKFIEVTLGLEYRVKGKGCNIFGGPFQYIKIGLGELGLVKTGKILALIYAVLLILASLIASIPFQAHEMISVIKGYYGWIDGNVWGFGMILSLFLAVVLFGGVKRVAFISSTIVPVMAFIYIFSCIVIIIVNFQHIHAAFYAIIDGMFCNSSVAGGALGALIAGFRRAVFANEAGIGTSPIAHSATKEDKAIKAGLVAMLEPCVDTMLICLLTGLVITITGVYHEEGVGILITRNAFATVSSWFPIFLSISVPFFAFSTMIAFSYYCEAGWLYLFKNKKSILLCRVLIVIVVFFSTISDDLMSLAKLGDMLFMCLAIPNLIAMYLLRDKVVSLLKKYQLSLKG